jgi:uncharacterized protein YndB with AHSA1/START domain
MTNPTAQKTQTMFRQGCSVRCDIHAPAGRIWALLTNGAAFPEWNSTIISLDGTIALGEKLALKAKTDPSRTFTPRVTRLTPAQEMEWSDGFAPMFKGRADIHPPSEERWGHGVRHDRGVLGRDAPDDPQEPP